MIYYTILYVIVSISFLLLLGQQTITHIINAQIDYYDKLIALYKDRIYKSNEKNYYIFNNYVKIIYPESVTYYENLVKKRKLKNKLKIHFLNLKKDQLNEIKNSKYPCYNYGKTILKTIWKKLK